MSTVIKERAIREAQRSISLRSMVQPSRARHPSVPELKAVQR